MDMIISLPTTFAAYRPLPTVIAADDFDTGMNGWLDLRPNFVGPDFRAHSDEVDLIHWGPVMLSSATFAFGGTHGSAHGTYSLKISSRAAAGPADQPPAPGSMGLGIKRLTIPADARFVRVESTLAYKAEQDRPGLGVNDVRAFGLFVDLQDGQHRYMPGVRYVNSTGGQPVRRWQYYSEASETHEEWNYGNVGWHQVGVDPQWFGSRYPDGSTSATSWFPDGDQHLVYNESDDKINWMRLSMTVDIEKRAYVDFTAHNRRLTFPPGAHPTWAPPYANIQGLLNPVFFVESDTDRRVSLFLDSVLISTATTDEAQTAGFLADRRGR
ncbi:DUF6772 family protein [[Mycobacterium] appelbergii]|uniref:DUF6772 family protein n=1 Tax=[Mycobacterium] appelbergii TaxID=2939269 RepID=UPI002938FCCF|nr:DUF6772 family protein [Mycobacterium sp. 21AC1]